MQISLTASQLAELSNELETSSPHIPNAKTDSILPTDVEKTISLFRNILFPNYFTTCPILVSLSQLSHLLTQLIEITQEITEKEMDAHDVVRRFMHQLPLLKESIGTDVQAMYEGDPAAEDAIEVILCYPAIKALVHYRMAHALHVLKVPILPRLITEIAHKKTGIDIHPGANIGNYFAIDHGTGVVIGETCIIGNHVRIYQGVTLGAKSFKTDEEGKMINIPRHPIIEDSVIIYSNSTILGRITIGHDSIIGGNVWCTQDLPAYSQVQQGRLENNIRSQKQWSNKTTE